MPRVLTPVLLALLLGGCGNKGPLVRPQPPHVAAPAAAASAPPVPAARARA